MVLLGDILVARGDCSAQRIAEALDDQLVYDGRLGTNLVELGAVTEAQLARALSEQQGVPATWGAISVDQRALAFVPAATARACQAVPLHLERRYLDVLVTEVRDPTRLDELAFALGKQVRPVLVPEARLWELMRRYYGVPSPLRRVRVRPRTGSVLASTQELLAELQGQVGRPAAPRRPRAAAPVDDPPRPDDDPVLSDARILAELQVDAARRYPTAGVPLSRRKGGR